MSETADEESLDERSYRGRHRRGGKRSRSRKSSRHRRRNLTPVSPSEESATSRSSYSESEDDHWLDTSHLDRAEPPARRGGTRHLGKKQTTTHTIWEIHKKDIGRIGALRPLIIAEVSADKRGNYETMSRLGCNYQPVFKGCCR